MDPMYQILDGRKISTEIKQEIAREVAEMVKNTGRRPHLSAILVGHDGGSEAYMASKVKSCEEVGFGSSLIRFDSDVTEERLLQEIDRLNSDDSVDGFIIQLPLPKHIDEQKVIERIDYRKDVDGFHPINVGRMSIGLPCFVSATPQGIVELLRRYAIPTRGKHCVVLGRSNIVGKPIAQLLMQKGEPGDCTVTVCHSRTPNIKEMCLSADIIIAALGSPEFVTADMVRKGTVLVDVGTTRVPDATKKSGARLVGDVKFDEVAPLCSYITPVPGGVGPMTIVSLMMNTLKAAKKEVFCD
nr:bifunctional methylenetetrahydrofolate dehydrogenase/methenyltetrahydrofolate cyclohydrolase FolD [uncultured Porphyromonas sp.]